MFVLLRLLKISLAIACLTVSLFLRTPFTASLRAGLFWSILAFSLGLILFESIQSRKGFKVFNFITLAIACSALITTLTLEGKFHLTKRSVLNADSQVLEQLGQHFIVGYRDPNELKTLVEKRAIGGIFLTTRNIQHKTKAQISQEIASLQQIRLAQKLAPLWIAADQEGGIVSRLSPPLTKLPALAEIVSEANNIEDKQQEVIHYAETQGKELAEIGVNLNFAPVVDLNKNIINPQDKFSQIYRRAISADPLVVEQVAVWYCQTLEKFGVRCTLKHFPGLGGVFSDTHIEDAKLQTPLLELAQADWIPFRGVTRQSQALMMLGHARLMQVDPQHPVSFSQKVVTDIVRNNWQYKGVLVTDDFGMQAVYASKDGLKGAAVKALNAGVDLILVSYDKDLYYEAMAALLKAKAAGDLNTQILEESQSRLNRTTTDDSG